MAKHIHFIGIGGSAISAVSIIAKKLGYIVSGCDLEEDTAYLAKVRKVIKEVFIGHGKKHLEGVDMVVVTPAVFFQNKNHPEILEAKRKKILMTWQKFLGKFLHKGKKVICITGTHGKSTTTAMSALVFERAGLDPNVIVGAKVPEWEGNYRYGKGDIFVTEADEFYDNFLNYYPDAIVLNNIEFDHPDYFNSEKEVIKSFYRFIVKLRGRKILIINQDSPGIKKLFNLLPGDLLDSIDVRGYTFRDNSLVKVKKSAKVKILKKDNNGTSFEIKSKALDLNNVYNLRIPGEHSVFNAAGVVILAKCFGIENKVVEKTLIRFRGIGRRLELIGEKKGIKVYDDYAHHPTAIKATLSALRQFYPQNRIWAVVEPHSYSRTKALLKSYNGVFSDADEVIVGPIFKARDKQKFGVSSHSIVEISDHRNARSLESMDRLIKLLKKEVKPKDIVLVMGAGKSYDWSRKILDFL